MPKTKTENNRRDTLRGSTRIPVPFFPVEDKKALKKIKDGPASRKQGFILDLSTGGMRLVADQHLSVGGELGFKIYILDKVRIVSVHVGVAWASKNIAGLHSHLMKPVEMDALTSYLQKAS